MIRTDVRLNMFRRTFFGVCSTRCIKGDPAGAESLAGSDIILDADAEIKAVHETEGETAGEHPIDKQGRQHADACVENAVQGVGDIGLRGVLNRMMHRITPPGWTPPTQIY